MALALELAAAVAVAAVLLAALSGLMRWITARWGVLFGAVHGKQSGPVFDRFRVQLEQQIRYLPGPSVDTAVEYARRAYILGVVQGFRESGVEVPVAWIHHPERTTAAQMLTELERVGVSQRVLREAGRDLDKGTRRRLSKARKDALDRLDKAAKQVRQLAEASLADVVKAVAPAQTAGTISESTMRSAAVETLNQGIRAAAVANGARVFWVSERDGKVCRWCASLSGTFPGPDGIFRPHGFGSTDTVPYRLDASGEKIPLTVPPQHPHCRCRLGIWRSKHPPGPDSEPVRLQREARELVLGATTEPTEQATQPTAADRLIRALLSRIPRRRNR